MKRIFTLLAVAVCAVALFSCSEKPVIKEIPVAVQLYSVRGDMENDFYGTLKAVKQMGYDGVEFAGLYGNSPEQVKAWCDELGLTPVSAHVPLGDMLADIDKVIADYKTIGCEYIAIPWVDASRHPDGPDFWTTIHDIKDISKKTNEAGIVLLYHNHDFEFKLFHNNGRKHPEPGLDFMYSFLTPEELQTELDLCWVKFAGNDPVSYIEKYAGRVPVLHFKDYYTEGEQDKKPYELIGDEAAEAEATAETVEEVAEESTEAAAPVFEFRPLGSGVQDVAALLAAAEKAECKWIVIEQDQPSMGLSPMESIKQSVEYLKKLQKEN